MNEGGQSSTGQLIDFVMSTHPAYPKLLAEAEKTGSNPFTLLGERLDRMRKEKGLETASVSFTCLMKDDADGSAQLTKDLHFYPDLVSLP
jgi:ribulose kinase